MLLPPVERLAGAAEMAWSSWRRTADSPDVKTIGVVHDDLDILRILRIILENEDYHVVTHHGALGAYWLIAQLKPELVILGMRSAGLADGHLLAMMDFDETTASMPVLVCVALSREARKLRAVRRGQGSDVLLAPIDLDLLLEKVRRLTS